MGRERLEEKKVMVLVLLSAPLLQSPRQHACRALKRGVITDKNNGEAGSVHEEKTREEEARRQIHS